jgi:hypothetical protein
MDIKYKTMYNKLLKREKKAELYIDNPNIAIETVINNYIPEYQKIVKKLSVLMLFLPDASKDEILNGFKLGVE